MARLEAATMRAPALAVFNSDAASSPGRFSAFGSLDADALDELRHIGTTSDHAAGATIFTEGEPAVGIYNVLSGAVRLSKLLPDGRRQVTGFMFASDFLGIASNETHACTAEAIAPTRLCCFARRGMASLAHPLLEHRLLSEAANELAAAQDQMLLLGRKTAQERVASFLLELTARARRRGLEANPVPLPMSRTDIADYLGLTTETVSRCFTKLKTASVIRLEQTGSVTILEPARLAALAQGQSRTQH